VFPAQSYNPHVCSPVGANVLTWCGFSNFVLLPFYTQTCEARL